MSLKKQIIPLAAAVLLAFTALPAKAATVSAAGSSAELEAEVDTAYTVVIPVSMSGDQSLSGGINNIGEVKATDVTLAAGTQLTCRLSGGTLTRETGTGSIAYNAYYGEDTNAKTAILTKNNPVAVKVYIEPASLAKVKSGTYKGTLDFEISITQ